MKNFIMGSKHRIMLFFAVAAVLAVAVSLTMAKTADRDLKWSKAILTVSNMTCGGCIDTIKKSVASLPGTGNVNVDLASSTAEVMFDDKQIKDPQVIAQAITDGGYPADIQKLISPRKLSAEISEASELSKTHIAKVGSTEIPREDFEIELAHARTRYQKIYSADMFTTPQGKQLLQRLKTQIALRLIDEAVKFQEVDRAGFTLKEEKIDSALSTYAKDKHLNLEQLENNLKANGYPFDHFKKNFARRVTLQNYLEENVFSDSVDPDDRQKRYGNWLANARTLATVVYYDKNLESLIKAGSASGCGGSGGGGCSASR